MKKITFLFISVFLLHFSYNGYPKPVSGKKSVPGGIHDAQENPLRIMATPEVYDILTCWAGAYEKSNPDVRIKVIRSTNYQEAGLVYSTSDLVFTSSDNHASSPEEPIWEMAVGQDVIVPVINSGNPWMEKIRRQGISPEKLAQALANPEKRTWGTMLGNGQNTPVHFYLIDHEIVKGPLAAFLGTDPQRMKGIRVENGQELAEVVQQDPYGIGFCELRDVIDVTNKRLMEQISFLPIDKNKNGNLDHFENIYSSTGSLLRGVWIGKYPKTLCRTIYAVAPVSPDKKTVIAFLAWVLTDGQTALFPTGNNDFTFNDRQRKKLEMLTGNQANINVLSTSGFYFTKLNDLSLFSLVIIGLIPFILAFMIGEAVVRERRRKKVSLAQVLSFSHKIFNENSILSPNGLYFDKTHTWAFMEKNGSVRIGIDDFLQHITGVITRVRTKHPGEKIKKGDLLLSLIQNGKQLNIYAPVSGIITAENALLNTTASAVNSSPYADGWVYMIKPTDWLKEIRLLVMAETYREWLKKEFSRLKDFLAVSIKMNAVEYAPVVLQDGGEIREGILADLGPEVWEDFQTKFIDVSISSY